MATENSKAELPKAYDPAAVEATAYQTWLDEKCFHPDPKDPGEPYSIVIPPPNVTGALHLGHAINNTLQDILTRKARMEGKNALWVPGLDHAGIATQAVVEKTIKEKEGKDRYSLAETPEKSREVLIERIWEWKQQYGDRIINQLKRLGCSCDWDRTRFTLDEMCAKAVRETFFKLFKDGLIYRGKRLVNWDIHLQTSISDDEIYHENVKTHLWHIKYPIVDGPSSDRGMGVSPMRAVGSQSSTVADGAAEAIGQNNSSSPVDTHGRDAHATAQSRPTHVTVATTRPETMLGDTAVAVHSEDPRWNWAIGKFVKLPLTDRLIPIIADDVLVDPKFGSGVVKVTPAHDPNDYAVWQRHQGKPDQIDIVNLLNPDGTLNDAAGPKYKGLTINKARHAVANDLKDLGLLVKEEPYETQVGHSDRSKTPIQPYLSDQWFVKMAPLAEPALEVVRDGTIKFFPERHAQQYLSWLGEKRDWPISRQLWWGHRIPIWHIQPAIPGQNPDFPDATHAPEAYVRHLREKIEDLAKHSGTALDIEVQFYPASFEFFICARNEQSVFLLQRLEELVHRNSASTYRPGDKIETKPYPDFGSTEAFSVAMKIKFMVHDLHQDPDVLDTWFSSALWPHSTLGWPEQTADLAKWYPTSVLLTGRDIITLWVARMVMMGIYNMGSDRSMGVSPMSSPSENKEHGRDAHATVANHAIPFSHVAINPTILDEYGKRMSKSAGNGVDPVDIIDTHGSDALRFTLTTMATETQDARMPVKIVCPKCQTLITNPESNKVETVTCPKCKTTVTRPLGTLKGSEAAPLGRMTSEKFDLGRNFANKLWNASRFAMSNLRDTGLRPVTSPLGPEAQVTLSLADKWIISRFNRTVDEANKSLAVYRFDQYAKSCYDFFWRDFCDWYVEAIKPAMKDPARAPQTAEVLAAVLDGALRLLHPMIPFITETIFWQLNETRPARGLPGVLECPPSKRLIKAAWPKAGPVDETAEAIMGHFQELIVGIRNVRNTYKVDPKKPVNVTIVAPDCGAEQIRAYPELVETLATCKVTAVVESLPTPPAGSVRATAGACEVFIEGLVDENAEKARIAKEREDLTRQIAAMKGRLGNEAYIAKAPPHLVEQTKAQLADAEAKLAKLG